MRKKILYTSNSSRLVSGFGRHSKLFLKYFYSRKNPDGTPKYEVVEAAQGVKDNDIRTKATPWKTIGMIPSDENSFLIGQPKDQNGAYDSNLGRMVAYGAATLEQILKDEKPTVLIGCEDIWGLQVLRKYSNQPYRYWFDCEWYDKFPCVIWTPADSLPTLPQIVDNAHRIKSLWMKASFAVRDLHEKGHKHVDLYPLLLDTTEYREFSDEERRSTKLKYGLSEDEIIFTFISRNQGRKRFPSLIAGFKLFVDSNPNIKAKLILGTCPGEGWNLKGFIKDIGIDPNLILVPYICHACGEAELRPITEAEIDCPKCGSNKALKFITIEKGVTEKQLVEIYNISSGYVLAANSGGFEASGLEALCCGVPMATTNYSYGESYIASGEVYELDCVTDYELGSNFQKMTFKPESIADFMQLVKDKPEEMKARGTRGRIWAEKTFNPNDILARIEKFIDDLPNDHGYKFDFVTEFPNLDAPFSNAVSESEFLIETYSSFFGVTLNNQDKNYQAMQTELAQGATRDSIYRKCKQIAENELRKRGIIRDDPEKYFLQNGKKRLLYEMAGDYGDSLISLPVLEELRKLYSEEEWDLYICCLDQYQEIYAHLEGISGFIPWTGNQPFEMWEGARGQKKLVDVVIAPQLNRSYIHNGQDKNMFHPNFSLTNGENVV